MHASRREQHRKAEERAPGKRRLKKRKFDRGFQEVPISPIGCQDGNKRFPQDKAQRPPKINAWRNNLTACSQYRNLYFVACLDWIYVYVPKYPHQAIAEEPNLKWQLPVSRCGLPGYIPPESSQDYSAHSVNNMLITDLGSKEVLVCACDDGDVMAYYTDTLLDGAQGSGDLTTDLPFENVNGRRPKTFFHQNVGKSAWGLAVHTEARLIAVSSNNHEITVFAPAIEAQAIEQFDAKQHPVFFRRQFNQRKTLKRHATNIPSISFCNFPHAPEACYLASTDISGFTMIWNVADEKTPVRVLGPFRQDLDRYTEDYDSSRDGWGVMFLDARSFTKTRSIVHAMGTCFRVKHDLNASEPRLSLSMYNISDSQSMVRNSGPWSVSKKSSNHEEPPETSRSMSGDSGIRNLETSDDEGEETGQSVFISETGSFQIDHSESTDGGFLTLQKNKNGIIPEDHLGPGISERDMMGHRWSIFSHYAISDCRLPRSALPQAPLLVLNPRKIHLFQSPDLDLRKRASDPDHDPIIYLEDPLAQQVPPSLAIRLQHIDRMNLYTQIPELGVVLVGSPKGRVAVLTLHLLQPKVDGATGRLETDVEQPMYTMRLDHLLPLKEQEEQGQRPSQLLIGISACPAFGMEQYRRRYRIFLSYMNHTVLAYEIGREGSGHGGGEDVFNL